MASTGHVRRDKAHWLPVDHIPLVERTIGQALVETARRYPDRPALLIPDGQRIDRLTYAELLVRARNAAGNVLQHAVPGDRIAIWSNNSVEWILLEYGCALSGTVVTALNTAWTDSEVRHALELTEPALIFAGSDGRGNDLAERARSLTGIPVLAMTAINQPAADCELPTVSPDDLFLIQFTSGTTGRSKAAALSHFAALNGTRMRTVTDRSGPDEVWLNPLPLYHIGGALGVVIAAMTVGGACTVLPRYDPKQLVNLLIPTGATRLSGVPTMLLGVLADPDFPADDLRIRVVASGGASVPPSLVRKIEQDFAATFSIGYGQSEHPLISGTAPGDSDEQKATTVGRPIPHTEVKIVDPGSGETVDVGAVGELCVRSRLGMTGYFRNPEATAATIDPDGFLHTGDLCSMDEDGYIQVHGRQRDVIIRGGENVYPAEVEDVLLKHPAVAAAAVVGVDDPKWGQQVAAFVTLVDGAADGTPSPAALEAFAAQSLAHFKIPRRWEFVDGFPMTASGKIRKVDLEQRLRESPLPG